MQKTVEIAGKSIQVDITDEANTVLKHRKKPLAVEMELLFSCLIRKALRYSDQASEKYSAKVTDGLILSFNPVMTKSCSTDFNDKEPPLTDFPIVNPKPYVPSWVRIDYRFGDWYGEFGYTEAA